MRSGTGGPVKALTCRPWASNLRISSSVLANLCLSICLCLNCVRAAKGDRLAQSNVVHLEFGAAAIGVLGMSHERLRRTDVNGCVSAANFGALTSAFMLSYMLSYLVRSSWLIAFPDGTWPQAFGPRQKSINRQLGLQYILNGSGMMRMKAGSSDHESASSQESSLTHVDPKMFKLFVRFSESLGGLELKTTLAASGHWQVMCSKTQASPSKP